MTIVVPQYLVGKNVSAATITPMAVTAGTGVLTPGSAADLHTLGVFDSWELNASQNGFEISPLDGQMENFVSGKATFTFSVGEIMGSNMYATLLNAWFTGGDIFRFEADAVSPGGSVTNKVVVICTRAGGSLDFPIVEGKNTVRCTFRPCGIAPWYGTGTPPI